MRNRHQIRVFGAALAATMGVSSLALVAPAMATTLPPGGGGYLAPAYATGDLTGDHQITAADLTELTDALGTTSTGSGWSAVSAADLDGDGKISIGDVAALARKVIYDDGSFRLIEASALEMQKAMNAGVVTSVQLTQAYLDRIAAYDRTTMDDGDATTTDRPLNSVITTSKVALAAAAASDAARKANGGPTSMLDGIPVLLKDNYDTKDMPTSAGCGCWVDNQTADDAFMVKGLRDEGAIILGKASMDEFAYGFESQFSAGSEAGQSLFVASPYNTTKTAGGSSGGTGASISANLGAIGFGTDTGGSIRVPSSYNQLVGLRPTVGLTSRDGIVPLALSQDTGGPLARSVSDVAVALDAVVGADPADAATTGTDSHLPGTSYTANLAPGQLAGKHFAYFTSMVPPATATNAGQVAARRIFLDNVVRLRAAGATVTEIDPAALPADPTTGITIAKILGEGSGSTNEFKHDLNDYIASHLATSVGIRSLAGIVASGRYVPSYKGTYTSRDAITDAQYKAWIGTPEAPGTHTATLQNGQKYLTQLMDDQRLDAVIYPTGVPYGTYASNLRLSPNTGMPALTVPMGQTTATETLPGAGVNLEFLGRDFSESDLIGIGYSFERITRARTTPKLYPALPGETYVGPGVDTDAPGTGAVTVSSSATTLTPGQSFSVTVHQSADDLYAYDLGLGFDPAALQLVSASTAGGTTGTSTVKSSAGDVSITHTKLGSSPGAEGDTALATLTFKALRAGTAKVDVTRLTTVDSAGWSTPAVTPGGATVGITKISTTLSATLKPAKVKAHRKVRLTVVASATGTTPTGVVTVTVGGKTIRKGVVLHNGWATITFSAPKRGKAPHKKVVVTYLPTANFAGAQSAAILTVKR